MDDILNIVFSYIPSVRGDTIGNKFVANEKTMRLLNELYREIVFHADFDGLKIYQY
jgi:hypothetical protein